MTTIIKGIHSVDVGFEGGAESRIRCDYCEFETDQIVCYQKNGDLAGRIFMFRVNWIKIVRPTIVPTIIQAATQKDDHATS